MSDEQEKSAPIQVPGQPTTPAPAAPASESSASAEAATLQPDGAAPHNATAAVLADTPGAYPAGAVVGHSRAVPAVAPGEDGSGAALVARAASHADREVMFVPLAVSIGDGFKFGCGFFLAMVLALLVGFVALAVLFVVTSLLGLNLPITR